MVYYHFLESFWIRNFNGLGCILYELDYGYTVVMEKLNVKRLFCLPNFCYFLSSIHFKLEVRFKLLPENISNVVK